MYVILGVPDILQTNVPKWTSLMLVTVSSAVDMEKCASAGQNMKLACMFIFEKRSSTLWTALVFDSVELSVAAGCI